MNNALAPMVSFGWRIGWRSGNCSTSIWLSGMTLVGLIAKLCSSDSIQMKFLNLSENVFPIKMFDNFGVTAAKLPPFWLTDYEMLIFCVV